MIFLKRRAMMSRFHFNYKTVAGTGSLILDYCAETNFAQFRLLGNSAQGENPTLENRQEIVSCGKWNEATGKYLLDMKVTGKNLLEGFEIGGIDNQGNIMQNITAYININKFIEVEEGKHIINSRDGKRFLCAMFLYDKDKQFIRIDQSGDCIVRTGEKYVNILVVKSLIDGTDKVQIELADKNMNPTPYEPYHEPQTVRLELEKPLTKWDRIEKRDGVWGVACQTGHMTLTGNDEKDGGKWYEGHNDLYSQYHIEFADNRVYYKRGEYEKYAYCNVFKAGTLIDRDTIDDIIFVTKGVYTAIGICSKRWSNLDGFKKYLQENPLEVIYRTSKEEFVPLPKETQLVLESLYTFDGTTTITVDSGEVETGIEVEYAVKN